MTARVPTRLAAILAAALLFISACGSDGDSSPADDDVAPESPTASPTEEVTATPEQVASVIAGVASDWREVIDKAGDCRFTWTVGEDDDPLNEADGMSCYMREVTIGFTAQSTVEALARLNVPDSMKPLVDETNSALQSVVDVDLEALCGEALDGPIDTDECHLALGERYGEYSKLGTVLDKWGPYL